MRVNKKLNIEKAKFQIEKNDIKIESCSSFYETDSWPNNNFPKYFNIVLKAKTFFKPHNLLKIIKEIEKMYGFDKPTHVRFLEMVKNYLSFEFGNSFFQDKKVIDLIKDKLPVSISLGLWTTLLVYFISIPLGISKAVRDGFRTYMPGRSSSGRHLLRYQHLADGFLLHHVLIQPIHPRPYQLERHE